MIGELSALARDCTANFAQRCSMTSVLQRLVRLKREHCQPTATDAQLAKAHIQLEQFRAQAEIAAVRVEENKQSCISCLEDFDAAGGLECNEHSHFLCSDCLSGWVQAATSEENLGQLAQHGGVKCPPPCAAIFSHGGIARRVPDAIFALYLDAKEKIAEQKINAECDARLEAERVRIAVLTAEEIRPQQIRKHIVDRILTLACPRCGQAFVDFDGCTALTCSRCNAGFCAWCLADCGNDAHRHVANCNDNKAPGRDVYANMQLFEAGQRERRTKMLRNYLAKLPTDAVRDRACQDCATDFRDLGICLSDSAS